MTPALAAFALVAVLLSGAPAPRCPFPEAGVGPAAGLGSVDPFKAPEPKATELNAAAKLLYRQGKWDDARAQYRAALTADPNFLAPRLNIACSFVRQDRFPEAMAEVSALIERAYVPWAREVLEAADLGALKVRPEMADLRRTLASAAGKWGEGLDDAVVFVGRQKAPLKVPETGAGVFLLNPHQELFAYLPEAGVYRQLTAEDGRVLMAARAPDRRRVAYVTGEKLVRGVDPTDVALRGVVLGELTLATMVAAKPIRVEGDVRRIEVLATPRGTGYRIEGSGDKGLFVRNEAGVLAQLPERTRTGKPIAVLTPAGAPPAAAQTVGGACRTTARDTTVGALPVVGLSLRGGGRKTLGERYGAGLTGLPLR
jgi:hypothetical protein